MSRTWNRNNRSLEREKTLAEIGVLRTAADDSARHVRSLYVAFLLLTLYVTVIALSTEDEQLLTGTNVYLPSIEAHSPLIAFYVIVPWLVLLFHAHLLNQFFLLSRKLFDLDAKLRSLPPKLESVQRRLPFPLIFSYRILGTDYSRSIQWAFRLAVNVIILLVPIGLLLTIQWKFLPYHSWKITLIHQAVLTLDLALLWFFLPRLSPPSQRVHRRWRMVGGLMSTILLLVVVWGFLIPPHSGIEDERLIGYRPWLDKRLHRNLELRERTLMRKEPPAELLYDAHEDTPEGRAKVWLEAGEALDLRGRDLRHADFTASRFWDVDLRGAQIQGAVLREAQFQGADLSEAQLQNVDLSMAQLQDAVLSKTQLQGADLKGAQLQGAVLEEAQLQGTDFEETQLQGADLKEAQLQGADLSEAQLQGAFLSGAQLQGADLSWTKLQGAVLSKAQLQGVDLEEAQLQGADLRQAEVYGTRFQDADFSLADLRGLLSLPVEWEELQDLKDPFLGIEELETRLEEEGEDWTRDGRQRIERAIDRFRSIVADSPLEPTAISLPQKSKVMYDQKGLFANYPPPMDATEFEQQRADYLAQLGCDDQYIAKGMQQQAWSGSESAKALQNALRDKAESGDCPVLAQVLAEED